MSLDHVAIRIVNSLVAVAQISPDRTQSCEDRQDDDREIASYLSFRQFAEFRNPQFFVLVAPSCLAGASRLAVAVREGPALKGKLGGALGEAKIKFHSRGPSGNHSCDTCDPWRGREVGKARGRVERERTRHGDRLCRFFLRHRFPGDGDTGERNDPGGNLGSAVLTEGRLERQFPLGDLS